MLLEFGFAQYRRKVVAHCPKVRLGRDKKAKDGQREGRVSPAFKAVIVDEMARTTHLKRVHLDTFPAPQPNLKHTRRKRQRRRQ